MEKPGEIINCSKPIAPVKQLFNRQWVNGDIDAFMASVKRRVKDMYSINLEFNDADSFIEQLRQHRLIHLINEQPD